MAGVDSDAGHDEEMRMAMAMSMENQDGLSVSENPGGSLPGNRNQGMSDQDFDFDVLVVNTVEENRKLLNEFERKKAANRKADKSKTERTNRKENAVELSGLPWSAKEEDIREFLKDCRIIKILIILNDYKKPSGNAMVWVLSKEDMENALRHNMEHLANRYVKVRVAREETFRSTSSDPDAFTVKLSGLPWSATEQEICEFLFGCEVLGVNIEMIEEGKPSGLALVKLETKADLDMALKYHKQVLGGRYLDVEKIASEDDKFCIKLNSLPWSASQQEICDFLTGCEVVGGLAGVTIEMNERGKPSGSAFVQLKTKADVEKAKKCNKKKLGTRYVDVETITSKDGEAKEDTQCTNSSPQPKEKTSTNTTFKEEQFCIKLSGLSRKATPAEIADFLSGGHVKHVLEIILAVGEKGKAGNAFVKIGGEEDLKVCMRLNAMAMGNREVEVTQAKLEQFEEAKQGKFFIKLTELSRKVTTEDISKFLSDGNVKQVGEVVITVNEKGKVSGNAFVKIGGEDDTKVALSLDKTVMGNRRIGVCQAAVQEFEEAKQHQLAG